MRWVDPEDRDPDGGTSGDLLRASRGDCTAGGGSGYVGADPRLIRPKIASFTASSSSITWDVSENVTDLLNLFV